MKVSTLNSGFTLIELTVTTAIVSILSAVAIPSFNESINNNNLSSSATTLLSELQYARSEAVKRNLPVSICGSTNSTSCNTSDWEKGRIVFIDDGAGAPANAGNGVVNSETILKVFGKAVSDVSYTPTLFSSAGFLTFSDDGTANTVGTLLICDSRSSTDNTLAKAVNVNLSGQARRAYDSDASTDDIVNNLLGINVACP
ncbi:MAG: type IV fimbrial biogenesis protein FimT [Kiritimatiellia bacterium]|jgi:type IV fimbrial biogenesis protein FimT